MNGPQDLVRLAIAAERLRWRLLLRRGATRAGLLLAGLIFLAAALAVLHLLAYTLLLRRFEPVESAAILLGADLVLALLLMVSAARMGPGRTERDALALRETARTQLLGQGRMLRLGITLATSMVAALRKK